VDVENEQLKDIQKHDMFRGPSLLVKGGVAELFYRHVRHLKR